MKTAGRYLAEERGAFDREQSRPTPEQPVDVVLVKTRAPLWCSVEMDADTVMFLARICNCTVEAFVKRYSH